MRKKFLRTTEWHFYPDGLCKTINNAYLGISIDSLNGFLLYLTASVIFLRQKLQFDPTHSQIPIFIQNGVDESETLQNSKRHADRNWTGLHPAGLTTCAGVFMKATMHAMTWRVHLARAVRKTRLSLASAAEIWVWLRKLKLAECAKLSIVQPMSIRLVRSCNEA